VPSIRTSDQSSLNAVLKNILTAVAAASVAMRMRTVNDTSVLVAKWLLGLEID